MTPSSTIKWTTAASQWAFFGLLIVVATLISLEVFNLMPFGRRTTQSLWFAIPAICAVLAGSVLLNIVGNLNSISDSLSRTAYGADFKPATDQKSIRRELGFKLLLPLVLILLLAFTGDRYTKMKKAELLLSDAQSTVSQFQADLDKLAGAEWNKAAIESTADMLELMGKQSKNFPKVTLLMADKVNGKPVVIEITSRSDSRLDDKTQVISKLEFIKAVDLVEKTYLDAVFQGQKSESQHTAFDGRHELFYPVRSGSKNMVLLFSDSLSYGKYGS